MKVGLEIFDAYNARRRERTWATLAFLAWCAVTLYTVAHHEPWRDEADSWLIARDRTVPEMWPLLPNVGMPIFLYLIFLPFAKLGLSYHFLAVAHWPIAAGVAALILYRSPFTIPTRIALVFTYFFAYEYAVVARFYSLTCLFIFALCVLSRKRYDGSLALAAVLFLLPNTSGFGIFFALAWGVVWGLDVLISLVRRRIALRHLKGVVLTTLAGAAGGVVAWLQLFPQPVDPFVNEHDPHEDLFPDLLAQGLVPYGDMEVRYVLAGLVLLAALWFLRKSPRALGVLLLFGGMVGYLLVFKRVGQLRHWGMFFVGLTACRWMALADAERTERSEARSSRITLVAVAVWFAQLVAWDVAGFDAVTSDIYGRYSNAEAMAQFIAQKKLQGRPIAAWPAVSGEALLPYLPGKAFYYPSERRFGTHMTWTGGLRRGDRRPNEEMIKRSRRQFRPKTHPLYLTTREMTEAQLEALRLRLVHTEAVDTVADQGELYWLYEDLPPAPKPRQIGPELPKLEGPQPEPPRASRPLPREEIRNKLRNGKLLDRR